MVEDFCRKEQVNPATYYRWQRKYGSLQVEDTKRLKPLEVENSRLKQSLLANDAIREFREKYLRAKEWHAKIEHMESKGLSQRAVCPDSLGKNRFIESSPDKFRNEYLQREWFSSLLDAQVVIAEWRLHYNTHRPHSSVDHKLRRILPPNSSPKLNPLSLSFRLGTKTKVGQ